MWRKLLATVLATALPAVAPAGPLKDAAEKAGRDQEAPTSESHRGGRFWTGLALIGGGAALSIAAIGFDDDDDDGDDAEDSDETDDGEDSDAAGAAALAGGLAAAGVGTFLLLTGRGAAAPAVTVRRGGITVRHTIRF
jgi:hypothetical protein